MVTADVPTITGLPIIGNLADFMKDPFTLPHRIAPQHGRVVRLKLGPRDLYILWHPDDVQRVLRDNHHNYVKGDTSYPLEVISGPALVNMEGETWLSRRRQMQPYFHRKHVMGMLDLMQQAIEEQFDVLDKLADTGQAVDLIPIMRELTAHVFTRSFYGIRLSREETQAMSDAMYTMLSYVWIRYIPFSFLPEWMPYPNKQKFLNARTYMVEKSRELIARRHKMGEGDDLLAMMMGMGESDTGSFSDEELLQETVSLFQGGFDTSSGTLGWVFYMLSQHPDVESNIRTEVDRAFSENLPIGEVAVKLTGVHNLIQETMRLYPSAPAVPRLSVAEDELASYRIPANSLVTISFYAVHRHPDFWDDPDVFKPGRFASEEGKPYKHPFAYVPFSSGPRMCIGDQFALYEMRLTIAALMKRYKFTLDRTYQLEESILSTYFPKQLPMLIEKR